MNGIKCPKCGREQEVNHDDGYGYEENETHEQSCVLCGYKINFTTSIMFSYESLCSDGHNMEPFGDKFPGMFECKNCDHVELIKELNGDE